MRRSTTCIILALLLLSCGDREEAAPGAPDALPRIRIGHVGHDHQIALYVAALSPDEIEKRCDVRLAEKKPREVYDLVVKDRPVAEVHLLKVGGGSNMPAAMQRGEIDVGLGGIPAVVSFVDRGAAIRILAPLNVDGDMLLVRPDFPAADFAEFATAVRSAERPVRIGYKAPVAVAKLVFVGALDAERIPWNDAGPVEGGVELVNLQGEKNAVPALQAGTVDGVVVNEPAGSLAVAKGAAKLVSLLADLPPDGRWPNHPCCCVCATEAAIAGRREVLKSLLSLLRTATEYIREDPARAATLAAEWTRVDPAVEAKSVPNITYLMDPGPAYRKGLETWYEMMRGLGQFDGRLKEANFDEAYERTHDLSLVEEISGDR